MDSATLTLVEGILVALYALLLVLKRKKSSIWMICSAMFLLTALYLRYSIDIRSGTDFQPYFESFREVKYGTASLEFLVEPYRLALFEGVLLFRGLDDLTQISIIYYFHFVVVTIFFTWLAFRKEITFEAKLILFLAYYPPMAFVWIRSGMAFAASCFMFLAVTSRRYKPLHYLLPLVHASVIPLLVVMKIKDLRPSRKFLIVLISAAVGYMVLESTYVQYIIQKLEYYSETAKQRTSIDLLLFHIANTLVFIYLAVINSKFRKNFAVLVLMGVYILLYFMSPVIGLRVFPLVLIASIAQKISFPRYQLLTFFVCAAYLPVYFVRFDQVIAW